MATLVFFSANPDDYIIVDEPPRTVANLLQQRHPAYVELGRFRGAASPSRLSRPRRG